MIVPEVLAELGDIARRTFSRWRELGLAPRCLKLPNGELRVYRSDFLTWLGDRMEAAA